MIEIDKAVGARIRALRLARRMTQDALARQVGVQFQQIQKYESGTNRISASRLFMIAGALGVPVEHFFEGVCSNSSKSNDSPLADGAAMEMLLHYARLTERQKAAVLSVLQAMEA